jgi:hypothetical protein
MYCWYTHLSRIGNHFRFLFQIPIIVNNNCNKSKTVVKIKERYENTYGVRYTLATTKLNYNFHEYYIIKQLFVSITNVINGYLTRIINIQSYQIAPIKIRAW